jgi:hypothetical protein
MTKSIPLSRGKFAIIDDEDYDEISKHKWSFHPRGYAFRPSILMHRQIMMGENGNFEIDHINGNGLDNRRCNLRFCTRKENQRNRGKPKNNKSGHKGVVWSRDHKKWRAQSSANHTYTHLGYFDDVFDAVRAYEDFAKKEYGEFFRK